MAIIEAFPGIRYDLGRVGTLSDVIAPPYDVIDDALQAKLLSQHPNNVIRLELPTSEAGDTEGQKYQRAGMTWKHWLLDGIVRSEGGQAVYVLHQSFEIDGAGYSRQGVIARVRLERVGAGNIYDHEATLSGPKEDRLRLMDATHANFSPVFGLYSDPSREVQQRLNAHIQRVLPIEATDHLGVTSRVWTVMDQAVIRDVAGLLHDKPVFIADGHHRYETAIRYRDDLEKKQGLLPHDHPANYVMMALIGMSDPGLLILPTHRLVSGHSNLTSAELIRLLEPYFEIMLMGSGSDASRQAWELIQDDGSQDVMGFGTPADDSWILARFTAHALMSKLSPGYSPVWQQLAVSRLHVLVLDHLLGQSEKLSCRYVHLLKEVVEAAQRKECDLACLLPAVEINDMTEIAGNLEKMPPKSTYFYPKLLTGLVFHSLK